MMAVAALVLVASCDSGSDSPAPAGTTTDASDVVCGFFPKSEVERVVGSASYSVDGTGMLVANKRQSDTASCTVVGQDSVSPPVTAVVADLSRRRTAQDVQATLKQEAAASGCRGSMTWAGLGTGNLCRSGDTTTIAVLTKERLIRVELTGRTSGDRPDPAAALRLAKAADNAADEYDATHS